MDLLRWAVALSPLVLLLILLAVLRWKAPQAAGAALLFGAGLALLFFQLPFDGLAVALGKGVWDSIPILYVVFPALLLYHVGKAAGAFDSLRRGIARFSKDEVFLVLAFGWVFASFLQGIAGFGTPIAVVAPLLVAVGVRPLYAVVIPLIGHAWANMFGTLAVGWLATLQVVELEDETTTAVKTALLLWVPNLLGALTIAFLVGRKQGVLHALPMIGVISLVHGGVQLALMPVSPILSTFVAASLAMLALYPLSRWSRYSDPTPMEHRGAFEEGADVSEEDEGEPSMSLARASAPYGVLTLVAVAALVIPPLERALASLAFSLPFPRTETGYDYVNEAQDSYQPFEPLTHPGTFLLIAVLAALLIYRGRQPTQERDDPGVLGGLADDSIPSAVSIVGFLVLARVLEQSGMIEVLARGIAEVAPAPVYAVLATFIGVAGAFMTSSNTASNVLFGPLQSSVAMTESLSQSGIIAAQSNGGAIGNAIAPANIVLGTSTAGATGQEGQVLRKTLPWAGVVALVSGLLTLLLV